MSTGIDEELRAAFAAASDFVQPPPTLAGRVRAAVRARRRRRALVVTAATCVVALLAVGLTYAAAGGRQSPAATHRGQVTRFRLPHGYQVSDVAANGSYLYVLFGQVNVLAAYNRATGKLIRRVTLPDSPGGLAVGPGGLVWVNYFLRDGASAGLWLLTPDLRLHSFLPGGRATLPVGSTTALVTAPTGVGRVTMPVPGTAGHGQTVWGAFGSLGPPLSTAPGAAALLDGRLVVEVTNRAGLHPRLIIAGQPSLSYAGGPFTSTGSAVWLVTRGSQSLVTINAATGRATTVVYFGPLVRLDGQLRPTTPATVQGSALLSEAAGVWSHGNTIWVSLSPQTWATGPSLVCFTAGSRIGRITTLPVRGSVLALAATRYTVYVSTVPAGNYGALGSGVSGYRVPAACR
jgi:hypothetical protein